MSERGKRNSRSALREEIRAVENLKAQVIHLNEQRLAIKRIAWETGNADLFERAAEMKVTLIRLKKIYSRYYTDLAIQLEDNEP